MLSGGRMTRHRHADPADLDAQSDLIGAPEPMSITAVLGAPGGYLKPSEGVLVDQEVCVVDM
jgi:hypothetical protein